MMSERLKERLQQLSSVDRELIRLKLGRIISEQANAKKEDGSNRLVAYVEPQAEFDMDALVEYLKAKLPGYMIPSPIVLVDKIPRLPNGKIDRNSLRELQKADSSIKAIQKPRTELEQNLVEIWEEVMNFSPISIKDNFFEIGGDSILSIQIIAKARNLGITIKPNQLFEHQSIAELSEFLDYSKEPAEKAAEVLIGDIALTPIQDWFFETHKNVPNYWNQIIEIRSANGIDIAELEKVIYAVIKHRDALRLSFEKEFENWKAVIRSPKGSDHIISQTLDGYGTKDEQDRKIQHELQAHQSLSRLDSSPLFRLLHFSCHGIQDDRFYLIAHHLVTDHVSWNLIIEDINLGLKEFRKNRDIRLGPKITSLKDWSDFLSQSSVSKNILAELLYWKEQIKPVFHVPIDKGERKRFYAEKNASLFRITMGTDVSQKLAENANSAYSTRADELIIAALIRTLAEWTKSITVQFGMEKHGRPANNSEIDVSNTVGWFTSFFPVSFQYLEDENTANLIKSVKEQLRSIPADGIGFGILKYKSGYGEQLKGDPELIFNYLGHQRKYNDTSEISFEYNSTLSRDPNSERSYIIEINSYFLDKQLQIECWYATEVLLPETVEILMKNFVKNITEVTEHCVSKDVKDFTPSDFPDAGINQEDLDNILGNL